jgi:hypothetical protein
VQTDIWGRRTKTAKKLTLDGSGPLHTAKNKILVTKMRVLLGALKHSCLNGRAGIQFRHVNICVLTEIDLAKRRQ